MFPSVKPVPFRAALTMSLALLMGTVISHAEVSPDKKSQIDGIVHHAMQAANYPSAVVLVDQGGLPLYRASFGYANLEHDIGASDSTAYAIGSITKSFTALAILQLVEQGAISLDAPLGRYLPEYRGPAKSVAIRHLLTHTAGIPNYVGDIEGLREELKRRAYTRKEMTAHFEELPLMFEPGLKYRYSNSGYYLLGLVVEAVSGKDYYAYLESNVFKPLGLTRTFSGDDSELIVNRASGYNFVNGGFVNASPWFYVVPFSAGSLISTVDDLVTYRRGVFKSHHFSQRLKELVVTTTPFVGGATNFYALGALIVSDFEGHRKYSHGGSIYGFASAHAYYPDDDLTIVILTNRQAESLPPSSVERKIARVILDLPPVAAVERVLSQRDIERYTGDYTLDPIAVGSFQFGFICADGRLVACRGGVASCGEPVPMLAQGDGVFRAAHDDEWRFEFTRLSKADKAHNFVSQYRDLTFFGSRRPASSDVE